MAEIKNKGAAAKALCAAGTILTLAPIAFTVLTSAIGTAVTGRFHFDYLMPAELFPVVLAGALLLVWAARRTGLRFRMIGLSSLLTVIFFGAIMAVASLTGLASGATKPEGMPYLAAMSCLVLYTVSMTAVGIGGILMWKDLRKDKI